MSWKLRTTLLTFLAVPSLVGFPSDVLSQPILPGLAAVWPAYFMTTHLCLLVLLERKTHAIIVSIAALIVVPVVFVGGGLSFSLILAGWSHLDFIDHSLHYTRLCITMLTVIPLSLSIMATIPFQRLEYYLLRNPAGVSKKEKAALMFLRVFNHIVFFVIPDILEVVREEKRYNGLKEGLAETGGFFGAVKKRLIRGVGDTAQLAIESICASIQYIPLWAIEIARLPDKAGRGKKAQGKDD